MGILSASLWATLSALSARCLIYAEDGFSDPDGFVMNTLTPDGKVVTCRGEVLRHNALSHAATYLQQPLRIVAC